MTLTRDLRLFELCFYGVRSVLLMVSKKGSTLIRIKHGGLFMTYEDYWGQLPSALGDGQKRENLYVRSSDAQVAHFLP